MGKREPEVSHFTDTRYWTAAKSYEPERNLSAEKSANSQSKDMSIQTLRHELLQLNAWPEAGDTFLELLEQAQGYGSVLVATDYDWLGQVADSAYAGEDIGSRYPSIFQKLLTHSELRHKFIQMLQIRSIGV